MDNDLMELYKEISYLKAQVEFKDYIIYAGGTIITCLSGVIVKLYSTILSRSEKDSDIIRDKFKNENKE